MCVHQGYPLVPIAGGNVFLTDEDLSTGDGLITCRQVPALTSVRNVTSGLRALARLAAELGL